MSLIEKLALRPAKSQDEWRKELRRDLLRIVAGCALFWSAAGAFTVWLLAR